MPYTPGPFDSAHLYLQWGGKLPGNEQWSNGLRMAPVGASASNDPVGMLSAITSAVQAFHTAANANIHTACKLSFVKLNYIAPSGHYAENVTYQQIVADVAGAGPGSSGMTPPNQIALAISLTTDVTRGPAHRGRFYLPMPATPVQTDGLILATTRDNIKTQSLTFINALNAVNTNYKVAVFSRKLGSPMHRTVLGVQVGRVLDTQRRRRRSLVENY